LLLMARYARHQEALASALLARRGTPAIVPDAKSRPLCDRAIDEAFGPRLADDHQRTAVETALERSLLLICGGPGTGKTHTLRRLLLVLRTLFQATLGRDPAVALAAPTGKAAVRMGEVLRAPDEGETTDAERAFLTSLRPTTVHALLRNDPSRPGRFQHDAARPLSADVVVVDEASMVDLSLMAKLAAAVPPMARLVLLGDKRQLASVEAGSVLADLISPEATALAGALVELTRVHRTRAGTPLARLGAALTLGTSEELTAVSQLLETAVDRREGDLATYPHADNYLSSNALAEARAHHGQLVRLACTDTTFERGTSTEAATHALAALGAFRVLTPHREGPLGVRGLGERLARDVAPAGLVAADGTFPGTPLLVLENRPDLGLANGDVGVLCRGPNGRPVVAFAPLGTSEAPRFFDRTRLPAHEPCFAMTVHKSQGSQYGTVLFVLPAAPSRIVTRELVYTALTRARERFVLAGSARAFRSALDRRIRRASSLADYLAS
jgi:exodeoxyribonuclease V alpha subunit